MATSYSNELDGLLNAIPGTKPDGRAVGGRMRRYRATIDLASQSSGEIINLCRVPYGSYFAYGILNSTVPLGPATVKVGDADGDAIYKAAGTFTTANVSTMFGHSDGLAEGATAAQKNVILTTGGAGLPASGTLVVDMYFTQG